MEKEKTPISLWLTVIFGTLFVLCGAIIKLQGMSGSFGEEKIEDLLAKSTSKDKVFDYELRKDIDQYNLFDDKGFNAIAKIENKGLITYSFRLQTDIHYGQEEDNYYYELGRIQINPENSQKSKCSYKFRTIDILDEEMKKIPDNWTECSESQFIKNIYKIAPKKAEAFEPLKEILDLEDKVAPCDYVEEGEDPACDKLLKENNWDELSKKHKEILQQLRSITLEEK